MNHTYVLDNSAVVYSNNPYIELELFHGERLRPQCHQLLLLLIECKKVNCIATFDMIGDALWSEDGGWGPDKKQSLKDCVREINRIFKCVENVRGCGYVLTSKVLQLPFLPVFSLEHETTRGWTEYAIENLQLKELEINRQFEYVVLQISKLLEDIESHLNIIAKQENGAIKRIITGQLVRMRITVEAIQKRVPSKRFELQELSEYTEKIIMKGRLLQNEDDYEFDKQVRNIKSEYDILLNWCLEAKIELDRDKQILLEYQLTEAEN